MPLPSRTLLLLLAGGAALFLVSPAAALTADAVLLATALLDAWIAPRPVVDRELPAQLSLGATGIARLTVRLIARVAAPWGDTIRVRITDDLPEAVDRLGDDAAELPAPGDEAAGWSYRFRPWERGVHVFGDIHVRVRGPLGLAWRQHRLGGRDPVLVLPGLAELRRHRLLGLKERLRRAGVRNVRLRGEGHAFESLREYVRGDDPRTIDWKATAHRGALIVREYEAERSQSVVIALDAGRMMSERIGDRERLDHAMSSALLLADVARLHGDRVGFFAFADEVLEQLPPRRLAVDRLADAMARVPTRTVEPNYPLAFNTLRSSLNRRALVVMFTDVIDPTASHALIAQLSRSARRHLVLAVALRNPALETSAARPVDDAADAYRRAAAEEMLEARSVALGQMRRAGIQVADVTPADMVTAVINRYLELKYRGRL
ncbi:MAG: DUF58 domain-containing protein [Candidatus Longimicrobiales bacterium M2_2A_002]